MQKPIIKLKNLVSCDSHLVQFFLLLVARTDRAGFGADLAAAFCLGLRAALVANLLTLAAARALVGFLFRASYIL